MLKIDTGHTQDQLPRTKSAACEGLNIRFTDWTRADRFKRQIIEAIESIDDPEQVREHVEAESLVIDALHLSAWPEMAEEIDQFAKEHRAMLRHGAASAHGGTVQPPEKERKMFNIPTSTGGDQGPFLSYKQRAGQGMPDGSWYMRSKDGEDWHYTDMTDAFRKGFVSDVFATHDGQLGGSLKLGFIKFQEGVAPERHWFASPLVQEPRPDEGKTVQGGFEWQNAVAFRVAIGGGESASFDVAGWGGYKGVMSLLDQMNKGFAANVGKCPVVQYTGFRVEGTGQKRLHVPEFTIATWVDRPACLTPDAPVIAPAAAPAEPEPAPAPAPAAAKPAEDMVF